VRNGITYVRLTLCIGSCRCCHTLCLRERWLCFVAAKTKYRAVGNLFVSVWFDSCAAAAAAADGRRTDAVCMCCSLCLFMCFRRKWRIGLASQPSSTPWPTIATRSRQRLIQTPSLSPVPVWAPSLASTCPAFRISSVSSSSFVSRGSWARQARFWGSSSSWLVAVWSVLSCVWSELSCLWSELSCVLSVLCCVWSVLSSVWSELSCVWSELSCVWSVLSSVWLVLISVWSVFSSVLSVLSCVCSVLSCVWSVLVLFSQNLVVWAQNLVVCGQYLVLCGYYLFLCGQCLVLCCQYLVVCGQYLFCLVRTQLCVLRT